MLGEHIDRLRSAVRFASQFAESLELRKSATNLKRRLGADSNRLTTL